MVKTPGGPPPRIFSGYWVVLSLSVIVFLSAGIRFTIGPFLKPVAAALGSWLGGVLFDSTGGYRAAFSVAGALLLIAAGLSITIDEAARPAGRALTLPGRPYPVAGGR